MKSVLAYVFVALQLLAIGESKNIVNPHRISMTSNEKALLSRRKFELGRGLPLDLDDKVIEDMVERASKNAQFGQKVVGVDGNGAAGMPSSNQLGANLDTTIQTLQEVSVFSSLVRDVKSLDSELSSETSNVVIFAPSDSALNNVDQKPWQHPINVLDLQDSGASEQEIDEAINDNVSRFVLSHVVSCSDFSSVGNAEVLLKSDYATQKSAPGDILLKKDGDSYYVAPASSHNYVPARSLNSAVNGVIFVIDGVLAE